MARWRRDPSGVDGVLVTEGFVGSTAPGDIVPSAARHAPDDAARAEPPPQADTTGEVAHTPRDAVVANVTRHLRLHPEAQVYDDQARLRPLTGPEAERIAQVTLRAVTAWLKP